MGKNEGFVLTVTHALACFKATNEALLAGDLQQAQLLAQTGAEILRVAANLPPTKG